MWAHSVIRAHKAVRKIMGDRVCVKETERLRPNYGTHPVLYITSIRSDPLLSKVPETNPIMFDRRECRQL